MSMYRHMKCYGSTVIGEKGQVVVPAELRKKFKIKSGDKFLVMAGERGVGITLLRVDSLVKVVKEMFGPDLQGLLEMDVGKHNRKARGKKGTGRR